MISVPRRGPTTPHMRRHTCGLGSSPVARHYWGNHCYFLFLQVLRCFSSLRLPGSRVICTYPWLIAAYHVLHRLREPRHPPDALTCFRHKIEYVASASTLPAAKTIQKDTLPAANYSLFAHTFSCKLRVVKKTLSQ